MVSQLTVTDSFYASNCLLHAWGGFTVLYSTTQVQRDIKELSQTHQPNKKQPYMYTSLLVLLLLSYQMMLLLLNMGLTTVLTGNRSISLVSNA